jgi:hypothetical protein
MGVNMAHDEQPDGSDRQHHHHHGADRPPPPAELTPIQADQFDLSTFRHSDTSAAGEFHDTFIMKVTSVEANGVSVAAPGLNTAYGLYLTADTTGHETFDANGSVVNGGNVFDTFDVKLMLDPTNNDGTPGSPLDGSLGFSDPGGTADDIVLATGSLDHASVKFENGAVQANFAEFLRLTRPGMAFLHGTQLPNQPVLEERLTSSPSVLAQHTNPDGSFVAVLNGGQGTMALSPQQPISLPDANENGFIPALLRAELLGTHADLVRTCAVPQYGTENHGGGSVANYILPDYGLAFRGISES